MKNCNFGIVIKVKNLTVCKAFYRDILGLGDPVQESNFRVEFNCGGAFSLFLEKKLFDEPIHPGSVPISWYCSLGNASEIWEKMKTYGFADTRMVVENKAGRSFCRFTDPEGNAFYVPAPAGERNSMKEKLSYDAYENPLSDRSGDPDFNSDYDFCGGYMESDSQSIWSGFEN